MSKKMNLKCKREIPNSSRFTIGKRYEFKQAEGIAYNVYESKDDNGEV